MTDAINDGAAAKARTPKRLRRPCMRGRSCLTLAAAVLPVTSCMSISPSSESRLPDGPLSKAEIERCLEAPHKVGANMVLPVPRPGYVFKPGYNFSVRQSDGSYGFGHQQASNGRLTIRYPAQHSSFSLDVVRRNGVVYFGKDATSCR
jgi:hypothetical protein